MPAYWETSYSKKGPLNLGTVTGFFSYRGRGIGVREVGSAGGGDEGWVGSRMGYKRDSLDRALMILSKCFKKREKR